MTLHAKVGSTWENIQTVYVKVSGVWRRTSLQARVSGVWEMIKPQFSAFITGSASPPAGATVAGPVTANGVNGAAVVSYSWSRVSGDATIQISSTTAMSVTFTIPSPANRSAVWRCTVTDAHGSASFADIGVNFSTLN